MAFTFKGLGGAAGLATANAASVTLTTATTAGAASDLAVLLIAVDNNQTTDGDEGAVTSVTDNSGAGNTWLKAGEFTNGQAAAQAGATVGIWYCYLNGAMATGSVITVNFNNAASRDAQGLSLAFFTTTRPGVALEGTATTLANDAAAAGSMAGPTTSTSIEILRIRATASEASANTVWTKTAAFDGLFTVGVSTGGTSASKMGIRGEYEISTGNATLASAPTGGAGAVDNASLYVCFKEVAGSFSISATLAGAGGFTTNVSPVIPSNPILRAGSALVTNLLACYLPGVKGGAPVSGTGPTLSDGAGGAGTVVSTVEGSASRSNTLGSAKGLIATAPSAFKSWTNFTVYWRGLLIGAGDAFCPVVGVSIGDTDTSPYFMLNVSSDTSYAATKAFYGDSTTSKVSPSSDVTSLYGQIVNFCATATVGGNVTFYVNGTSIGTNTLTTISTSSSTSKIVVNQGIDATSRSTNASVLMACFWDRALSSTEVATLNANPYALLDNDTSVPRSVGKITRLGYGGHGARRAGNFSRAAGANTYPITATLAGVGGLTANITKAEIPISAVFAGVGGLSANVTKAAIPIAATFAGVGGLAADVTKAGLSISATFAGVGGLTADVTKAAISISVTFAGVGGLSANVTKAAIPISATFAGVGGLTADVIKSGLSISATFAGVGGLTANVTKAAIQIAATFGGIGGLSAATSQQMAVQAVFGGAGSLVANLTIAGAVFYPISATFVGVGGLSANVTRSISISATFAGVGGLAGNITSAALSISVTFAGIGGLTANAIRAIPISATFAGVGGLSATVGIGYSISATFAGVGGLSAQTSQRMSVTVTFAGVGGLTAQTTQRMNVAATLGGIGSISGDLRPPGPQTYSISATFAGVGGLSAAAAQRMSAIPTVFAGVGALSANTAKIINALSFNGVGGLSAALSQSLQISATFAGVGNLTAILPYKILGDVTFGGVGGLTANLTVAGGAQVYPISATFAGVGGFVANALITKPITATFAGIGGLVADLSPRGIISISATFSGVGGLTATTSQVLRSSATFAGVGGLTVAVSQIMRVSATFAGVGGLSAQAPYKTLGNVTFAGVGGMSATVRKDLGIITFAGVGGMVVGNVGYRLGISAIFAGVGGMTARLSQLTSGKINQRVDLIARDDAVPDITAQQDEAKGFIARQTKQFLKAG